MEESASFLASPLYFLFFPPSWERLILIYAPSGSAGDWLGFALGPSASRGLSQPWCRWGTPHHLGCWGVSWVLPAWLSPMLNSHLCSARGEQDVVYPTEFSCFCFNFPIPLGNVIQYMYDEPLCISRLEQYHRNKRGSMLSWTGSASYRGTKVRPNSFSINSSMLSWDTRRAWKVRYFLHIVWRETF